MYRELITHLQSPKITIKIRLMELLSGILNIAFICAIDIVA